MSIPIPVLEDRVCDALQSIDYTRTKFDTLTISKKVFGYDATKAMIKPILYNMHKRGLLLHERIGNLHVWSLP